MAEDIIIEAIKGHLNALAGFTNLILLVSLAMLFMVFTDSTVFEFSFIKAERKHTGLIVALLFFGFFGTLYLLFLRLGGLLRELPESARYEGLLTVLTHPWVVNPFSLVGTDELARRGAYLSIAGFVGVLGLAYVAVLTIFDRDEVNGRWLVYIVMIVGMILVALGWTPLSNQLKEMAASAGEEALVNAMNSTWDDRLAIVLGVAVIPVLTWIANGISAITRNRDRITQPGPSDPPADHQAGEVEVK